MEQDKELELEEMNILSAPLTEKCQLSGTSASDSLDLGSEEIKNSNVCDTPIERSVADFQLQIVPISSTSAQLENINLDVTKVAGSESLTLGHNVDFKISDSHIPDNGNATKIDEGCKETDSLYTSATVDFVDLKETDNRCEEMENSKVCDTPFERNVAEFQLQSVPQLENMNLDVTKMISISKKMLGKSLTEGQKVDIKMSDSYLPDNENAMKIDKGCKEMGSVFTVATVDFVDLTKPDNQSSTVENVTFIDLTVNDEEQRNELQKAGSALITRKHVGKARHVPYSAKLSRHMHLRTISGADQNSADHASAHTNSLADLIPSEKLDSTDVTEILVSSSDHVCEGAYLNFKPSTGSVRSCNHEQFEISTNILADSKDSRNEPMSMSLHIEVTNDFSLVNNDDSLSSVNEASVCFENMSLHASDDVAMLIKEDASSSDTPVVVASNKLPFEFEQSNSVSEYSLRYVEQQSDIAMNAASNVVFENDSATYLPKNALHANSVANNTMENMQTTAAAVASIKLPGECEQSYSDSGNSLANVQDQGNCAVNAASSVGLLLKNGSPMNLPKNVLHTSSVSDNTVADLQENRHAVCALASEDTHQQKSSAIIPSTLNNLQHRNCNSVDTVENMPLNISKDSRKNVQVNEQIPSKSVQQTSKSKNLQKENYFDVIPSGIRQRISVTDVSEIKGLKINAAGALKTMEPKSSSALCLPSNAQQSSTTVDASKSKEHKVSNATITAKSIQQRNSCNTSSSGNVQQNSNSATANKISQTNNNTGNLIKAFHQQNTSAASTFDGQQSSGSVACLGNSQPPKHNIGSDFSRETQQENIYTKLNKIALDQSEPVFKHPNILKPSAQVENINSYAQAPSGKIDSSQNMKTVMKTGRNKNATSFLSINNIQYQPLQDCQDLMELASCKTTDYRVHVGKPKYILEESSRANTFERFKNFQFSRATDNDVLELYGRLPVSLPEDLEETPICKEDITDFTVKKNKIQDLEKVLCHNRH